MALCTSESPCAAAEAYLALCQLLLSLSEHRQPPEAGEVERLPSFIGEVKEYIDKNYLQIESTGALADKFFYSREHISRAFKRYYNTSVYEYILDKRLLYCQACLKRGESVELAAHHAGFVNMSSFFKIFKKRCGCSPSEYKAKQ
jgi:AraC-like DNA-binding protein